ncbi:MAG: phage minor head protein [Atopobiaceae bacterium]
MYNLDSYHFAPAHCCFHQTQSCTTIGHSFCSILIDLHKASYIEIGRAGRRNQPADTVSYHQTVSELTYDIETCDEQAAAIINGESPAVYAENMNYGTFDVEQVAKIDTSYTLVDADTVTYMVQRQPDLLPQVSVSQSMAETWARRKITSAMMQSILQGESVPDAAKRIRSVVEMYRRASLRAARTSLTGAENAGRIGSYQRASGMGIELQKQWMATLDSRTRDSHRELDGEKADIDAKFSNGLSYPGDPAGPASEVWNCRCTMVAALPGHDVFRDRNTSKLETSYEDWKAGRDPKQQKPAGRTMASFFQMPGTIAKLNSSGISMTEARKRLTEQLKEYGISSGSFRKLSAGDQQKVLDAALARGTAESGITDKRKAYQSAKVDVPYVLSSSYSKKFNGITGNAIADKAIANECRAMLVHRSGTSGEDLSLISRVTGEVVAKSTAGTDENQTVYTKEILDAIAANEPGSLISVHNHPTNLPPTGSDFGAQVAHSYGGGVVALHNGEVYYFEQGEPPEYGVYFDMKVSELVSSGMRESDAMAKVLHTLQEEGKIRWKKL